MKKVLAVIAVVCVVCVAGAALAQPKARENNRPIPQQVQQGQRMPQRQPQRPEQFNGANWCPCGRGQAGGMNWPNRQFEDRPGFEGRDRNFGPANNGPEGFRDFDGRGRRGYGFAPDMPTEIREKAVELAKLRIDLEAALSENPINKAAAIEAHEKMQKLENEIESWRFEQRLDRIEAMRKQQELNKNVKPGRPVPPAPKAEVMPEAPAPETESAE